jgi:hypothetical protein
MKAKQHIAIVACGALMFCGVVFALGATLGSSPAWYHEPAVLPIRAAIWASGNAHDPSAVAGYFALAIECLFVGILTDVCILGVRHWWRPSPPKA